MQKSKLAKNQIMHLWGWIASTTEANWETKCLKTKGKTPTKHHTTHKNGLLQQEVRQANQLGVCSPEWMMDNIHKKEWWLKKGELTKHKKIEQMGKT